MVICLEQGAGYLHLVQLIQLLPSSLDLLKSRMVNFSGATLARLSWRRGR